MFEECLQGNTIQTDIKTSGIIEQCQVNKPPIEVVRSLDPNKKIVLFGASSDGLCALDYLNSMDINADFFCDNNSALTGQYIQDVLVLSFEQLIALKSEVNVVISSTYYLEIAQQLIKAGLSHTIKGILHIPTAYRESALFYAENLNFFHNNQQQIKKTFNILHDGLSRQVLYGAINFRLTNDHRLVAAIKEKIYDQYFDHDILKLSNNEVFVDGGAFDGDTIKKFIYHTQNRFNKILAFEPDSNNYCKLSRFVSGLSDDRISLYQLGLYDKESTIGFNNEISASSISSINETAANKIQTVFLDKFIGENITFIKMDIEGAELKALQGAANLITTTKPKLAICIYHKPDDLWKIPLFINSLVPSYRIFLRHYSNFIDETVCYATL